MTFEEAEKAQEYLVQTSFTYGVARAEMVKAEAMLRHVKALVMKASDETAISAQERDAYASDEYAQAIDDLFQATAEAEKLKAAREAARVRVDLWRSFNANMREAT